MTDKPDWAEATVSDMYLGYPTDPAATEIAAALRKAHHQGQIQQLRSCADKLMTVDDKVCWSFARDFRALADELERGKP